LARGWGKEKGLDRRGEPRIGRGSTKEWEEKGASGEGCKVKEIRKRREIGDDVSGGAPEGHLLSWEH